VTLDDLLDRVRDAEGVTYAEPPAIDQPTGVYGVTLPMLSASRGRPCTVDDLKALTPEQGRAIVRSRFDVDIRKYGFDRVTDPHLQAQLLDFAWNSGESRAIRWLQRTVGLPPGFVTGTIDDRTIAALERFPGWLVNNALAGARAHAAYHGGTPEKFAAGVARRALEFVIPLDEPHVS